jgi:diadenosine tetraphosphate (Ap4A) HIT family hydrolase
MKNATMRCECFFCPEGRFFLNKAVGLPCEESIVFEDEHIFVIPDIAPLVVGHFLIVAKKHYNSFGNADDSVYRSLTLAKDFLDNLVFRDVDFFLFEHGAVVEQTAGTCIDHAHMHALPFRGKEMDIENYLDQSGFITTIKVVADRGTLSQYATQKQPYIFYETRKGGKWAYPVGQLPHQFLRMMITAFRPVKYNWKLQYQTAESKHLYNETLEYAANQCRKVNGEIHMSSS